MVIHSGFGAGKPALGEEGSSHAETRRARKTRGGDGSRGEVQDAELESAGLYYLVCSCSPNLLLSSAPNSLSLPPQPHQRTLALPLILHQQGAPVFALA